MSSHHEPCGQAARERDLLRASVELAIPELVKARQLLAAIGTEWEAVEVRGRGGPAGVRIEVLDNGPGLPAPVGELARRSGHGHGPRGRGLAIALAVAQSHGGRLAVAPRERGARLVLELPVANGSAT